MMDLWTEIEAYPSHGTKALRSRHRNFSFALLFILTVCFGPLRLGAQSGVLDATFNPGTGVDLSVYSIVVQTNGQIVIGGDFTSFDDVERINVARLNANGSRDDGFNPGAALGGSFTYVSALALQTSGKVLVGGSFTNVVATNFARLNTNGSLDNSFAALADDTVNAIAVQSDGSILIGGFFTHVNGQARTGVARLSPAGALDPSFNPSISGAFSTVYSLALQGDGRILVAGSFTNISGSLRTNIARLNTNGTLDITFKQVSVGGAQLSTAVFYGIAIDAQGRLVVGGDFTSVNGLVHTNLARFTSDGSLDNNFAAAAGTDFAVSSIAAQTDGKILIGGGFNTVNGVTQNYIARLNSNGALDGNFNPGGGGASDFIWSMMLQPDGKVLIGGDFTEYNSMASYGIARLQNTIGGPPIFNPIFSNNIFTVSIATVAGKSYTLQFKNALSDSTWASLPPVSGDGTIKALIDASASVLRRFYRAQVQ